MDSLRGKLLIASPTLVDPNFSRSVVLVAAHDHDGAMGLVLNRPSAAPVAEMAPDLADLADPGALLHLGGPVAPEAAIVLAEFTDPSLAAVTIFGDVGLPSAEVEIDVLAGGIRRARVFAGHAGWSAGQLDDELVEEAWIVGQLPPDELWDVSPDRLWATALERKGGSYALVARMPADPSVN